MRARLPLAVLFAFTLATFAAPPIIDAQLPCGSPSECELSESSSSLATSSGGCLPPSAAVDLYAEAVQQTSAIEAYENTEENCAELCEKFVDTCDDIAKISRDCLIRGGGEFAELVRATCSTLDDPADRRACKDDVNYARGEVRDCAREDRDRAGGCCDAWYDICEADCLDQPFVGDPPPLCFTGPGGYAGGTCFFGLANVPL